MQLPVIPDASYVLLAQQVQGNGHTNGGWNGQEGGAGGTVGKMLRADGSINVRTENVNGGVGSSYEGISPDSVCGAQAAPNGLASPARRAPSGMSEWGTASDGTAVNSRDQLLSHQRATSSQISAGSPHAQVCDLGCFSGPFGVPVFFWRMGRVALPVLDMDTPPCFPAQLFLMKFRGSYTVITEQHSASV